MLLAAALRHFAMTSSGATVSVPTAPSWNSWADIDLQPSWTWLDRGAPDRAYDRAQLVGDRVVGPWFCLDRDTGEEVWHAGEPRPNTLFRIRDGMIVATETLSRGPTTGSFGVYGFELATGRLAWTHHLDGEWHRWPERLELVEGERGWERDGPTRLIPEGVVTDGGRVLDLQTGRLLRHLGDGEPREDPDFGVLGRSLYAAGALDLPGLGRLYLGTGETLAGVKEQLAEAPMPGLFMMPAHMGRGAPFGFTLESESGRRLWEFDLPPDRFWSDGNYYSYREHGRWIFLVYAEPTIDAGEWDRLHSDPFAPRPTADFFVSALDLETGALVASTRIGDLPANLAQIEALDERSLLVSAEVDADRLYVHIPLPAPRPPG